MEEGLEKFLWSEELRLLAIEGPRSLAKRKRVQLF